MIDELLINIVLLSVLVELTLIAIIVVMQISIYKHKKKIYFIKRDRERCNELLYSAKDGYFCFVYPDQKVKDPQKDVLERCSRRLSVMLNLKNGTASSFEEVADSFYKTDSGLLKKYVNLLQQEGKAFEDIFAVKGGEQFVCIYGNRVNGIDNNLYCDVIWFRDISKQAKEIQSLEDDKQKIQNNYKLLENMLDGINYPIWLRNENLELLAVNKKYVEYTGAANKQEVLQKDLELTNNKGEKVAKRVATEVQKSKRAHKKAFNMVYKNRLYNFEVHESPYFVEDMLDKIGSVGYIKDNTELEKLKRSFKINQNNHLEILSSLGTAFAIFDVNGKLFFYNTAFKDLWKLENEFLDKAPDYLQFIENIRERKILPPVSDFKVFKEEETSVFNGLLETKEDLLYLPDGRTIRRFRTPHPNGVIFAFEDVSDRLATMRRLNELTSIQQGILENLNDAVVIFGANQRLKFYNSAYLKLWGLDENKMQDEPKMEQIILYQEPFFKNIEDWNIFSKKITANIMGSRKFNLLRDDNTNIAVSAKIFYDGSIMITYTVK
ncbi:MAG: PAS-domain containing protein [Alphaproteobacteria bacterium]|nr:PAS-domain containing protein [Alphaproteobacteria bacterium]